MTLNEACLLIADCPHTTARDEGVGFPLVRTPNVGFGRLVYEDMHRVSKDVYDLRNKRAIPMAGDLIYAREAPAGNVAVIERDEKVCLGQRTVLLRPNPDIVDSYYLAYYLLMPEHRNELVGQASGATVLHVNLADICSLKVKFPRLETQKKIATVLNDYYAAIANCRKQIALLEEAAQRLYREWFGDGKGNEDLLWNVCHYTRGVSYTSKEIESPNGMSLITLKNIERFGGFREDRSKTFSGVCRTDSRIGSNGVLMAVTDMTKERRLVGHVALVPDSYTEAAFSMDLIHLTGLSVPDLFLYAMLRYSGIAENFASHASGANVIHLKPSSLDSVKVNVPDRAEIDRYLKLFEPMVDQKNGLLNQIRALTEARDRLLPKLISGEVAV